MDQKAGSGGPPFGSASTQPAFGATGTTLPSFGQSAGSHAFGTPGATSIAASSSFAGASLFGSASPWTGGFGSQALGSMQGPIQASASGGTATPAGFSNLPSANLGFGGPRPQASASSFPSSAINSTGPGILRFPAPSTAFSFGASQAPPASTSPPVLGAGFGGFPSPLQNAGVSQNTPSFGTNLFQANPASTPTFGGSAGGSAKSGGFTFGVKPPDAVVAQTPPLTFGTVKSPLFGAGTAPSPPANNAPILAFGTKALSPEKGQPSSAPKSTVFGSSATLFGGASANAPPSSGINPSRSAAAPLPFGTRSSEQGILGPAPGVDAKKQTSFGEGFAFSKAPRSFGSLAALSELDEGPQGRSNRRSAGEERGGRSGRGSSMGRSEEDER